MRRKIDFNKIHFSLGNYLTTGEEDPDLKKKSLECGQKSPKTLCAACCAIIECFDLPEQFKWSIKDVGKWIESLGFPEYRNAFEKNFIDGRKLILVDATALIKMNIKDLEDVVKIMTQIKKLYKIEPKNFLETQYQIYRAFTGGKYEKCKRCEFFQKFQLIEEFPVELNHFEKLHKWLLHVPNYQKIRIGLIERENLYFIPKEAK